MYSYTNIVLKVPLLPIVCCFNWQKMSNISPHFRGSNARHPIKKKQHFQEVIQEENSRQRPIVIDFVSSSPQYALVLGSLDASTTCRFFYKQPKGLGWLMMTNGLVTVFFFNGVWLLRLFFLA